MERVRNLYISECQALGRQAFAVVGETCFVQAIRVLTSQRLSCWSPKSLPLPPCLPSFVSLHDLHSGLRWLFNLLQLCIAGCVQWILVDLVSTFAFPCFLFQFLYFRLSCDAPKQMATPDEAFQTSAVQVNFSTRFGLVFPSATAAQEKIASMVTTWTRTQSRRTWWCLGKTGIWSPLREATKNSSRSEPGVLGGGIAGSFDGLLRSICFSRALLVVYSDFPWFRWSPSHAMFSLSVSLFPLELWYRSMPLSSWIRLKIRFRPQYFNSTFPLVLDEDSRRGLLHRSKLLPWWQLEWGLSRDVLGDAWARAWIWSGPGELGGLLQTVLTDFCVQFASVVHCWLCTVIFNWFRGSPSHWRVFSYSFSISDRTVISSNAPKQLVTPEETFQTSAVQFNFPTRLGWGLPPGPAAQETTASMVPIGPRVSREGLGDAWARAWTWSGPGELGRVLQSVLTDCRAQFDSVVQCWLCTVIFNWASI